MTIHYNSTNTLTAVRQASPSAPTATALVDPAGVTFASTSSFGSLINFGSFVNNTVTILGTVIDSGSIVNNSQLRSI
jgi:hypothetical protein